jgi:2-iminobutanoate/2-iminopropanoate deaminase
MDRAVKVTVFLKDMGDFKAMNDVYARFFTGTPPARTTVQAVLPTDALLEVDIVALQ